MPTTVLYWFDPADDHPQPYLEWRRRNARAILAAAHTMNWRSLALQAVPCVWIRVGTINGNPTMRTKHHRITAECVAFDAPSNGIADRIRAALDAVHSPWKLAVTSLSEHPETAGLPLEGVLVSGVYVKVRGLRRVEAADWESMLGMPVVMREEDELEAELGFRRPLRSRRSTRI